MGYSELEKKRSGNCLNICSSNVPFNGISSSEESNFIFHKNLPKSQQSTVKLCLKLSAFGMISSLLTFEEKYYEYGEKGIETKGLAIGGYESAFLADLVASYMFEKCSNQFK